MACHKGATLNKDIFLKKKSHDTPTDIHLMLLEKKQKCVLHYKTTHPWLSQIILPKHF